MYPLYTASAYASNGLFRSLMGGAFPLFSRQMFKKLTVQGGCSLLGGMAILLLPVTLTFYLYGVSLRKRSYMVGKLNNNKHELGERHIIISGKDKGNL